MPSGKRKVGWNTFGNYIHKELRGIVLLWHKKFSLGSTLVFEAKKQQNYCNEPNFLAKLLENIHKRRLR